MKCLTSLCPENDLKRLHVNILPQALKVWSLDYQNQSGSFLSSSTVKQAFNSLMTHLKIVGYTSQHLGEDIQRKAILQDFCKNLDILSADNRKESESIVWPPYLAKNIIEKIQSLKFQSNDLNHPMAQNVLPNIIVRNADPQVVKMSLLWVMLTTGLRSSEIYQISLEELTQNRTVKTFLSGPSQQTAKAIISFTRIQHHKTHRLGVKRFTPIIAATNKTPNGSFEPTILAKALAYLAKVAKLRTSQLREKWDSPIPPTKLFIQSRRDL